MDLNSALALYTTKGEIAPGDETWGINAFPDGQHQFWISEALDTQAFWVNCCLRSGEAVDVSMQAIYLLQKQDRLAYLGITYLYGSRCDKWKAGTHWVCHVADYIVTMLGIPGLEQKKVKILDPHHIKGPSIVGAKGPFGVDPNNYDLVIYPDESAEERFRSTELNDLPSITCKKVRDQVTGAIIDYRVPDVSLVGLKVLVADDICDGGATFIKLAGKLADRADQHIFPEKLDLYVTHLLQLPAIEKLHQVGYDQLFTTNSFHRGMKTAGRTIVTDVWAPQSEGRWRTR